MSIPLSETATADTLKKDVRTLAEDTMKAAREHVVEPAVEAVRRAGAYTRDALHETKDQLSRQATQAEHYASEQYDRTTRWVSANPLSAVGIGFAVGLVIASFIGHSSRR